MQPTKQAKPSSRGNGNGNGNSQPGPSSRAPVARLEPDPELMKHLSRFLISNGISLDIEENPAIGELMANFGAVVPSEEELKKHVAGAEIEKVDWSKLKDSPITVTIDLEGSVNKKFVVASVHYFEGLVVKKTKIYFQQLIPNCVEAYNIADSVQKAVSHPSFSKRKYSNMVFASPDLTKRFEGRDMESEHVHTCFYHHISQFANKLLAVSNLSSLLEICQKHTRLLNDDAIICPDFKRFLKQEGLGHLEIPVYETRRWEDAYVYLTQLSEMNPIFTRYHTIKQGPQFLNNTIFASLVYFQQILHQCIEICRDLNHPDNSISSIIPAIHQLRNHLVANPAPYPDGSERKVPLPPLGTRIVNLMETCFNEILHGPNQHFYEIATLLDPRFAYKPEYFTNSKWAEIENRMLSQFDANKFNALSQKLPDYRDAIYIDRPGLQDSPLKWWDARKDTLGKLLWEARISLCCPAVSIDAKFFFGASGGRFSHLLAHHYSASPMKSLKLAAQHQIFHGKGEHGKRILSMLDSNRIRMRLENPDSDDDEVEENIDDERKPEHLLPDVTVQQKNSSNSALDRQVKEEEPDVEVPAPRLNQRTAPKATVSQSTVARAPSASSTATGVPPPRPPTNRPENPEVHSTVAAPEAAPQVGRIRRSTSQYQNHKMYRSPLTVAPGLRAVQAQQKAVGAEKKNTSPQATVSQKTVAMAPRPSAPSTVPRVPPSGPLRNATVSKNTVAMAPPQSASSTAPGVPSPRPKIPEVHPTVAAPEAAPQVGRIRRSTSQYQNHRSYRSPLTVSPGLRAVQAQQKAVGAGGRRGVKRKHPDVVEDEDED